MKKQQQLCCIVHRTSSASKRRVINKMKSRYYNHPFSLFSEPCCFPMKSNPNSNETPCKLRPGFVCSPSQGPCCTHDTCRLKVGNKCRDDNGCRTASYCSGQTPQCPPSVNKPNKTICNEESVCYMGECTGSICIAFGKGRSSMIA